MGRKLVKEEKQRHKIDCSIIFQKKEYFVFCLIIVAQVLVIVGYGKQKQGYFVDEMWSYGLANSYYHPHVYSDDALSNWVSGDYFREYLEVSEAERFQYGSVIYNQKNDVHPPLFYMVLHTVCSFFPDSFSKWYAIAPNICYFCICMILLYKLGEILFDNSYQALMPVISYGFCAGAISNVIFIRMYALLTVWVLFSFYLHAKWIKTEYVNLKGLFKLMIISYLGYMSHYYYFVFAFFLSVCYIMYLVWKKRMKEIIPYSVAMFGSLVLVLVTFPTAYVHLFFGYRGKEAIGNLLNLENLFANLKRFYEIMMEEILANCSFLFWVGVIGGALLFGRWILLKKVDIYAQLFILVIAVMTVLAYIMMVAKIAPFLVDRYIFCVYPLVTLILVYIFWGVLQEFRFPPVACQVILIVLFLSLAIKGIRENRVQYTYSWMEQNIKLAEEHSGDDCIYITGENYKLVGNALELKNMGWVLNLSPEYLNRLQEIIDPTVEEMIVYVDESYNQDDIMNQVCQNGGFQDYESLFVSRCHAYVVHK